MMGPNEESKLELQCAYDPAVNGESIGITFRKVPDFRIDIEQLMNSAPMTSACYIPTEYTPLTIEDFDRIRETVYGNIGHDSTVPSTAVQVMNEVDKAQRKAIQKQKEEERALLRKIQPKQIIHHGPATIVYWQDGEKTVVKTAQGETYDEYDAFCAALAKKLFGTNSNLKRVIRNATKKDK